MLFSSGPVAVAFERLVTATPAQFERDLRVAWPQVDGSAAGGRLCVDGGGLWLTIELEALAPRRLGLFELPQLRACYRFEGGDEAARRRLLGVLDRAMQKGGG